MIAWCLPSVLATVRRRFVPVRPNVYAAESPGRSHDAALRRGQAGRDGLHQRAQVPDGHVASEGALCDGLGHDL